MAQSQPGSAFQELTQRLVQEFWNFYPTSGARIGRHEYDGRLPDLSPVSLRRRVEQLEQTMAFLDAAGSGGGNPDDWLSLQLLKLFFKREHFSLTELKPLENNPMRQVGYLNVGGYLLRDYAPLADRLRSATQVMQRVPAFLDTLTAALGDAIGRPVLEMSIEAYSGMARFYRRDLAQAGAESGDGTVSPEFNDARESAASALDRFVRELEGRLNRANPEFAIGSKLYSSMLETGEGLDVPLAQVEALGQADLERNLEQLAQVAESISPGRGVAEVVAQVSGSHPSAEGLLPETRDMLEDIRQALLDLDLITIPSEDRCQVVETPATCGTPSPRWTARAHWRPGPPNPFNTLRLWSPIGPPSSRKSGCPTLTTTPCAWSPCMKCIPGTSFTTCTTAMGVTYRWPTGSPRPTPLPKAGPTTPSR